MYQSIASELQKVGVERTWQQCQLKLKYYLQVQKGKPLKVADDKYLRLTINLVDQGFQWSIWEWEGYLSLL